MRYTIKLEAIGDNTYWKWRGLYKVARRTGTQHAEAFDLPERQWVCRIAGVLGNGELKRSQVYGTRDYTRANSKGSRGVMVYYHLDDGYYEVKSPQSWSSSHRYFARIYNGQCTELTEEEVRQCLTVSADSESQS